MTIQRLTPHYVGPYRLPLRPLSFYGTPGRRLGSGTFGTVHALLKDGQNTNLVVKDTLFDA